MERPRDVIKFLKCCQNAMPNGRGRLTFAVVEKAELQYSEWLYKELRDEIHSHLPVWRESLQAISRIGRGKFGRGRLLGELNRDPGIAKWLKESGKQASDIEALLFDFGVIGNVRDGRWIFKYKDDDLGPDASADVIVHFGFHRKLKLRKGGKRAGKAGEHGGRAFRRADDRRS